MSRIIKINGITHEIKPDADLQGANIPKINLAGYDLKGINLSGANLSGATLFSAKFNGANLSGANLSGAIINGSDLSGADLSGAILTKSELFSANLRGANLFGANLSRAIIEESDLTKANLTKANLTKAKLIDAKLIEANLSGANLQEADLQRADLRRADLSGANLSPVNYVEGNFIRSWTKLTDANLERANLFRADLRWANLFRADLNNAILEEADLKDADLRGADLHEANLNRAILNRADFTNAIIFGMQHEDAIGILEAENLFIPFQHNVQGVAFEIHNSFAQLKLNEFMNIIESKIPSGNYDDNKPIFRPFIEYIRNNNFPLEEKNTLIEDLHQIQLSVGIALSEPENIRTKIIMKKIVSYILKQPREFIETYLKYYTFDCMNAYTTGTSRQSCVKGMYERIVFTMRDTIATFCTEEGNPICKPEYTELMNTFFPQIDINKLFQEWYINNSEKEDVIAMNTVQRINHFKTYVSQQITEDQYRSIEDKMNKYIEENTSIFETLVLGGRNKKQRKSKRKSKTIKKQRKTIKNNKNKEK